MTTIGSLTFWPHGGALAGQDDKVRGSHRCNQATRCFQDGIALSHDGIAWAMPICLLLLLFRLFIPVRCPSSVELQVLTGLLAAQLVG